MEVNGKKLCNVCFSPCNDAEDVCSACVQHSDDVYTDALKNGMILMGRYVIGKVLGKGGFGITYLGYDMKDDCKVAIKEYFPNTVAHRNTGDKTVSSFSGEKGETFKSGAERFYKEAELLMRFNGNPNIINVKEFFYENNTAYFVMEYLEGTDLREYVAKKGGRLSEREAIEILLKLTEALIIVHSINVLHRDIAPDNIYMCHDGRIKLIDFGAARQVSLSESQSLTEIYKPGFAPFEQYQRKGNQGPWTDIYALGATIYYILKGVKLDDSPSRVNNEAIDMTGISSAFAKILSKMLAMNIAKRYQNVVTLNGDLHKLMEAIIKAEAQFMGAYGIPGGAPQQPYQQPRNNPIPGTYAQSQNGTTGGGFNQTINNSIPGTYKQPSSNNPVTAFLEKHNIKTSTAVAIAVAVVLGILLLCAIIGSVSGSKSVDNRGDVVLTTETPAPTSAPAGNYRQNVIDYATFTDRDYEGTFGNNVIAREQISTITFKNSTAEAQSAEISWDASQKKDQSVMAWVVPSEEKDRYHLYIGGNGGISCGMSAAHLFEDYDNVTSIDFGGNFHTENVTDMQCMFYGCFDLESIDVSTLDTSNVTNMSQMFSLCNASTVTLGNMDSSKVTDMSFMFSHNSNLRSVDVSMLDTTNVTTMAYMFGSDPALESVNITHFKTDKLSSMQGMFNGCKSLTVLDLSNFTCPDLYTMREAFTGCEKLQKIDLTNFAATGEEVAKEMPFAECTSLTEVVSNSSVIQKMFAAFQAG